ncbi:HNH endonuclease [Methylopila sp. M107]|uniref:HNH endonuclease n=1 Tax=Methylopila sp. M107 TaxID=1101190 RepID=UPI0018CBB5BC|nr:HNH endonuclease [Methylopila sp. M107]
MKLDTIYPGIGKCIYCNDNSNREKLTEEHIIPEAIGGRLRFKRASCNKCQLRIEKFEGRLNNRLFEGVRSLLQISGKGSNPRLNVTLAKLSSSDDRVSSLTYTGTENHPGFIRLEGLLPPSFESGVPMPIVDGRRPVSICIKNITACPVTANYNGHTDPVDLCSSYLDFTRLLAKIAHSFWIAERGISNLYPFLSKFILGESEPEHSYFVGRNAGYSTHHDDLHYVKTGICERDGFTLGYVDISLFSCFPVYNGYRVYVGSIGRMINFHFFRTTEEMEKAKRVAIAQ